MNALAAGERVRPRLEMKPQFRLSQGKSIGSSTQSASGRPTDRRVRFRPPRGDDATKHRAVAEQLKQFESNGSALKRVDRLRDAVERLA